MRTIKKIHKTVDAPIDDLITFRAMPTSSIEHMDPFLFLNHHGPQVYEPNNHGLPFGPHPHRGFETLTFILDGDLTHWDSGGGKSVINEGGIQWMTAGRGLVHAEVSSDEFKQKGGKVELIQLWLNLPAKYKMTEPKYIGLQKDKIPAVIAGNGLVTLHVISGEFEGTAGPVDPLTDISVSSISFKKGGRYEIKTDAQHNILFYVVRGHVNVNGSEAFMHDLVEFENNNGDIHIEAQEDSLILFGHALPFHEPIVAQGPFVMNNIAEIKEAYMDYQSGKMGDPGSFQ
jgi:quercetin 2,3-dioxygenase